MHTKHFAFRTKISYGRSNNFERQDSGDCSFFKCL
eukprot:UN16861